MAASISDPVAGKPRLRVRLSLRWKAFGALMVLLAVVHTFYGAFTYRQSQAAYRHEESERLARTRQMFDGLMQQSVQGLGRIAAQIAASTSADELIIHPLDDSHISPELLANLSGVQIFDTQGHRLGGFNAMAAAGLPADIEERLLASVQRLHRPVTTLWCQDECIEFVFEPAFDHDGREILISLGQPASETLQAFSREAGVDIALLSDLPDTAATSTLFQRRLYALTNAPSLLPILRNAIRGAAPPPIDQAFPASARSSSLLLLLSPLSFGNGAHIQTLFVIDETLALQRIATDLREGIAVALGGMLLSSAALWWFLTPLSRRLRIITRALPMLAEKRFQDAQAMLDRAEHKQRLPDELDLLTANARWLTQRLERLDNAEAASAAKSLFLATMSHEVRTPLNGILGLLELLQHSNLDAGQRDSVQMVRESAQALLRVLDDTLDLARIEAGRIDLDPTPFSIEHLLAGCAETVAACARSKGLKLVTYADPALPQRVLGDALRLRQVLGNLCSNAVKFTAAGRIAVRAELHASLGSEVRVRFSVLDTGIGIPAEVQPRLFQPFQQGGTSTAARYGGSGLGLSICQGLVERMGGRIDLVSTPGAGSEFSFWLQFPVCSVSTEPQAPALAGVEIDVRMADPDERDWIGGYLRAAGARVRSGAKLTLREDGGLGIIVEGGQAPSARLHYPLHRSALLRTVATVAGLGATPQLPALPEKPMRRLHILAVDDHPTNREVIHKQLSLLGHHVDTCCDGHEALRMLGRCPYDLMLTDLRMPEMDGIELVRAIRAMEDAGKRPGRLPVFALSAQPAGIETERCLAAGMDGCLSKPLGLEGLRAALSRWTTAGVKDPDLAAVESLPQQQFILDRMALARLLGGDEALADQLLDDFLRINTPLVAKLASLARNPNCEILADAAHRLLGSARTANAQLLARALTDLECAARANKKGELSTLTHSVETEFERVRALLRPVNV